MHTPDLQILCGSVAVTLLGAMACNGSVTEPIVTPGAMGQVQATPNIGQIVEGESWLTATYQRMGTGGAEGGDGEDAGGGGDQGDL